MNDVSTSAPHLAMTEAPHPVDIHVGQRVRERRKLLDLTQKHLGNALGLSFQQVQKYESGANRFSASKLFEAARYLMVPISYFYEGIDPETGARIQRVAEENNPFEGEPLNETHQLVLIFKDIERAQDRQAVLAYARKLAAKKRKGSQSKT